MTRTFFSTIRPKFMRGFQQVDPTHLVGGKGQSLQHLCSIGAPVPEGVILTTHFCAAFSNAASGLSATCAKTIDDLQNHFGQGLLIVRSSAVGEDGFTAAFAGLLESIFPVDATDRKQLESALLRCVQSRHAPRVVAYETARGVRLDGMAIVVQRLVDSAAAGVLFTDGAMFRGEWCRGQGQTLVDGQLVPGAFRLDRRADRPPIIERFPEDGSAFPLDGGAWTALVEYAGQLERRRGVALDIEWTIDASGKVWFVQARPVTHCQTYLYSNANISENFPTPVVPLLASFARAGYDAYFRNLAREFGIPELRIAAHDEAFRGIVAVHGARLYYNLAHIHTVLRLMPFGNELVDSFDTFVGAGASQPETYRLVAELRSLATVAEQVWRAYRDLPQRIARFEAVVDDVATQFRPQRLAEMRPDELAAGLQSVLDIRLNRWLDASLADCAAAVTYRALQALLRHQESEDPAHHHVLLEGLDVAGAWSLRALWELARVVAANAGARAALERSVSAGGGEFGVFCDALDPDVREKVDEWLDHFGFRGSGELLLTVPSLAEEPDKLLPLLHRYVELALAVDETSPGAAFARQKDARERMTAQYRRAFARPLRPLFDKLVGATQASVKFRERARFRQALLYSRLRAIALACGRTLVTSNQVNQPDDVFFLTYAEILELMRQTWTNHLEPADLIRVRRAEHAEQSAFDVPDVFTLGRDQCLKFDDFHVGSKASDKPIADGVLVGVAASGGLVTGRAAVLDGLADADRLCRGDVLVARQTDPGWAPLFFLVKGLVLERGGMLSHGSILARELGIPSVVGVPQATSRITHGRNIAVDGNAGHVQCLE